MILWLGCRRSLSTPRGYADLSPRRLDLIDHSLLGLFTTFYACFALVQFRSAVLTAEVPMAPVAGHEGHPDSIFRFTSITLASTAGFRHRAISTTG